MDPNTSVVAAADALRRGVFRVIEKDDRSQTLGTAFGVADSLALTCVHVVEPYQQRVGKLALESPTGEVSVAEVILHPNPARVDLALLRTAAPLPYVFAATQKPFQPTRLMSRGYLVSDGVKESTELQFSPRGQRNVEYPGEKQDYRIDNAFEFTGDLAGRGCSGAPLFDPDSGTVIGVISGGISTRERTWAIPLSAVADWEIFQGALSWNNENQPRFGALVNGRGASVLCQCQSAFAVSALERSAKFRLAWHVQRVTYDDVVRQFIAGPHPVMAIVGDSNVGKTWLMADLARRQAFGPMPLLRAAVLAALNPASLPSLSVFLRRSLEEAWAELSLSSVPDSLSLARGCCDAKTPLLILLDGVNEACHVRDFLRDWLPEAIGWCRNAGARLIMTSRSEAWPMVARSVPEPSLSLFSAGRTEETNTSEPSDITQRAVRLRDFSPTEASAAAQCYAIQPPIVEGIGQHPLLFRIAHDLQFHAIDKSVGRYRLIQRFIHHHLDEVANHLGLKSSRALWLGLQEIAAICETNGKDTIPWSTVAEKLGDGQRTVDEILSVGLLIPVGTQLRFTHDQVAEVLRPVPLDPCAPIRNLADNPDLVSASLQSVVAAILRLEADGDARFGSVFQELMTVFEDVRQNLAVSSESPAAADQFHNLMYPFCEAVVRIAQALPHTRQLEIERIYGSICDCKQLFVEFLAIRNSLSYGLHFVGMWLEEAPLPPRVRAQLLLAIAPWDKAWPWRWQDWAEPFGRHNFAREVARFDWPVSVVARLHRLLEEHIAEVRPLLIEGLANDSRIEHGMDQSYRGEATISSLCAGLLFHGRNYDFSGLLNSVARFGKGRADNLLKELARADPTRATKRAISWLNKPNRTKVATLMIRTAASMLEPRIRTLATAALEKELSRAAPRTGVDVAEALRRLDPSSLSAWDFLAAALESGQLEYGYSLAPVPVERFERAIALAQRFGDVGCELMESHDGPVDEQERLVSIATETFVSGRASLSKLADLASHKLHELKRDSRYAPWVTFAELLARSGSSDARNALLPCAFGQHGGILEIDYPSVAEAILGSQLTDGDVAWIVQRLNQRNTPVEVWLPWFARVRKIARDVADGNAIINLILEFESERALTSAEGLIRFWVDLDAEEQSPISRAALDAVQAGKLPTEIFSLDFLRAVFSKRLRRSNKGRK